MREQGLSAPPSGVRHWLSGAVSIGALSAMWIQVAKHNLKALVPHKQALRRVKRRLLPYQTLPENDVLAFEQGLDLIEIVRDRAVSLGVVLEVGTGWIPTVPQMLKACGAKRILLTDVDRLSDPATFRLARDLVVQV